MKRSKITIIALAVLFPCIRASAQLQQRLTPDPKLQRQVVHTGVVHSPLPLDVERSFEQTGLEKRVLSTLPVWSGGGIEGWSHGGHATIAFCGKPTISGGGSIRLTVPTATGVRVKGPADDPDYGGYGGGRVNFDVGEADWSRYNRIKFWVYPDCDGTRVLRVGVSVGRAGGTSLHLFNKQWNELYYDLAAGEDLSNVRQIGFNVGVKGREGTSGDNVTIYIDKIEMQRIEGLDPDSGWTPAPGKVIYSTSGYKLGGEKTAIVTVDRKSHKGRFALIDAASGREAFAGKIDAVEGTLGKFDVADFTAFNRSGNYRLRVGDTLTPTFAISDDVWENSLWRVLSGIFSQRCGYAVPGIHGRCHPDLCSVHGGQRISYGGGWHDAGDLSQQTLQTADVYFALLETYAKVKDKNPILAARLLEEAEWGIEFATRQRYGDGYRASSVGLSIWTDGIIDSFDDINTVRVQNLAYDNFYHAAYEAYAAMTADRDGSLQEYLGRIAVEDFDFAMERHEKVGYGEFLHFYEHTYNTSESQYMATISWAASMLYRLTGQQRYADIATDYICYTLDCQRTEPLGKEGIRGFFYRDKTRVGVVHYIHQSREQLYMQAMTALCETQPDHPDRPRWEASIRLYGDYIKSIMPFTAPYGMAPSGVYHVGEWRDTVGFNSLHLPPWMPKNAVELFGTQVRGGTRLDDEHYVKRFPVWFSVFNGNTAILLATGKAAAICGKHLGDKELMNIGLEQMYWTVGKNPFGQSLIYGEGWNYTQMATSSSGEMTGEMPVGIRSEGNLDVPYWPRAARACYKEVWVTPAGKWLSLAAEYE